MPDDPSPSPSPPPSIVSLEYLMREFLEEQKRLAAKGVSLETVFYTLEDNRRRTYGLQQALETVTRDQMAHAMRLDRYGRELRRLGKKIGGGSGDNPRASGTNEADLENSGIHREEELRRATEFVELKHRLATAEKALDNAQSERRDATVWWKQQRWLALFGALMAIFVAVLSVIGGLILWWVTRK